MSNDDDLQAALIELSREGLRSKIDVANQVLTTLLTCAGPVYVIVDGVDEIDEMERGRLVKQLVFLSEKCLELRVLISSRPEADLKQIFDNKVTVLSVNDHNSESIQTYVNYEVNSGSIEYH